jgi:hypothetical protein
MGYLLSAECQCGFQSEVPFGAGRSNFRTRCDFPSYCERCSSVVPVNLLAAEDCCPSCGSRDTKRYDEPSLREASKGSSIASWNYGQQELEITDAEYRCPSCDGLSLRFHVEVLID